MHFAPPNARRLCGKRDEQGAAGIRSACSLRGPAGRRFASRECSWSVSTARSPVFVSCPVEDGPAIPQLGEPMLVRSGSIFLFNRVRQAVSLHVQSSSTTEPAHAVVQATTAGLGPTSVSSTASITLLVPPGITEVRVDPMKPADGPSPKGHRYPGGPASAA